MMRFMVWSNEHCGWWKRSRHGYTTRTDKAGLFSFEEAKVICENANRFADAPQPFNLNEVMVEAPSREQIELDLKYPDR
jgi:hypothetical protein